MIKKIGKCKYTAHRLGKRAILYTLDAALGFIFSLIILGAIIGYLECISFNRYFGEEMAVQGHDALALLGKKGDLSNYYNDNRWFFNGSVLEGINHNISPIRGNAHLQSTLDDYAEYWLALNGSSGYVEINNNSGNDIFGGSAATTISVWVRFHNSLDTKMIFDDVFANGHTRFSLAIDGDGKIVVAGNNSKNSAVEQTRTTSSALSAEDWHHIIATIDPTSAPYVYVYVDNSSMALGGGSMTVGNNLFDSDTMFNTTIGAMNDGTLAFNGDIDDLRLYSSTLNPTQRSGLYLRSDLRDNIIASYSFDPYSSDINGSIDELMPRQYNMVLQLENKDGKKISNSAVWQMTSVDNYYATGERVFAIFDSGNIIDYAKARFYIKVK